MKQKTKRKSITLMLALCLCLLFLGSTVQAASFNLASTKKTIYVGTSTTLTIPGVKGTAVKWKSSAPKIVSVSKSGVMKGKKAGTAKVTGTYKGIKFTCKVSVITKKLNKVLYNKNGCKITLVRITKDAAYFSFSNTTKKDLDFTVEWFVLGNKKYDIYTFTTVPHGTVTTLDAEPDIGYTKVTNPNASTFSAYFEIEESRTNKNKKEIRTKTIKIR